MVVESVAGWPWIGWPDARGISGRMTVEYAVDSLYLSYPGVMTEEWDKNTRRLLNIDGRNIQS